VHQGDLACRPAEADEADLQPKPKGFGQANGFGCWIFVHEAIVPTIPNLLLVIGYNGLLIFFKLSQFKDFFSFSR
jgi:hypothetical protein